MSIRLFVAVPVPPHVRLLLAELQALLAARLSDSEIRWQELERSHLTLLFLGEVAESALPACRRGVHEAARRSQPFPLSTGQLGVFPGKRRPSVVWLGVTDETNRLVQLQASLAKGLSTVGTGGSPGAYRPHLTLGRIGRIVSGDRQALNDTLAQDLDRQVSWQAEAVQLFRSRLGPHGATHTVVEDVPLLQRDESQ